MATYSNNLKLTLLGTGEGSGTWGDTTNTNLGTLLEQAISGYTTQAIADGADTTITIPDGATGVARNMVIECTGTLTAARNLIVPSNRKLYFVYNNTTGGYAVTVKVSGQTGVSVPNGAKMVLMSNGTDIVEATNYVTFADGTAAAPSITNTGDSNTGIYFPTDDTVGVSTSGTERMRIDSSGNVGIGTSSPSVPLDVRTVAGTSAQINLYSGNNTTASKFNIGQIGAIDWDIGLTTTSGNFLIGGLGGSVSEAYRINRSGISVDYHTWSTGAGTERMRIDSSGNVGIGITNPAYKLVVSNAGNNGFEFIPDIGTPILQCYDRTASAYRGMQLWAEQLLFVAGSSPVERMRIDSSGNVGIGTSSPTTALDVNGGIKTARVSVTSPAASDGNVFSGTYTPTLADGSPSVSDAANSTAYPAQYMRVGNVITVSGKVDIKVLTSGLIQLRLSLPIASAFAQNYQCAGSVLNYAAAVVTTLPGYVQADATNDDALVVVRTNVTGAAQPYYYTFTYVIV